MAEAIISRLLEQNIYDPAQVIISEPQDLRRNWWQQQYQVSVTDSNQDVFCKSTVLLLAIKPQVLELVSQELSVCQNDQDQPLILSILAGVTLHQLQCRFPAQPIIRIMPNTPALVGAGMTAISPNSLVTQAHLSLAKSIFSAIGEIIEISETLMDAVTGLSGSGPAFVALMIEALTDGGVLAGLPRTVAQQLALQTVLGTAELIKVKQLHPAELKDKVTSPGGTTIAGVAQLEKQGFRSAVIEAVKAAYLRSQELGSD
jgi:pyrroline-5-carboxylate reductase